VQIPCDSAREIGKALSVGLKYQKLYESEHNLTQKLLEDLDSNSNTIRGLVIELNNKPTEIVKTNWNMVGIFSAITTVVVSAVYLTIYLLITK
jgi:hypothetical protein